MIKKPTLIVLLCAIVLGGGVYFWNQKQAAKEKKPATTEKPAFDVQSADIVGITLSRPVNAASPAIQFEKENGDWKIVKPIETGADQTSVEGIATGVATSPVTATEPGQADRLKAFGLDPAAISIEFQTKSGAKHTLLLGDKDFTGESVYGLADGAKTVDVMPQSLLVSADKSLDDLRDRSVLRVIPDTVTGIELKNASGEIVAAKGNSGWTLMKPENKPADADAISALMASVSTGRMVSIASETPDNLGKYGLAGPAITFATSDARGNKQTLIVGKKDGDNYFARDLSRPTIFRINGDLYKKLGENFGDFRDRTVLHFTEDQINRAELHNTRGTMVMARKDTSKDDWVFEQPDGVKGKGAGIWKVFSPIESARAEEVLDSAPAAVAASLAKPDIEVTLTDKDGKKITLDVSKPDKDFVYVRTSAGTSIFKMKNDFYDDLNFAAAQAVF